MGTKITTKKNNFLEVERMSWLLYKSERKIIRTFPLSLCCQSGVCWWFIYIENPPVVVSSTM
jgi:hypothetical protein